MNYSGNFVQREGAWLNMRNKLLATIFRAIWILLFFNVLYDVGTQRDIFFRNKVRHLANPFTVRATKKLEGENAFSCC